MKRKIRKAAELSAFWLYNRIAGKFLRLDDSKVVFASEARDNLMIRCLRISKRSFT